jgi:glutaredoxin 3
LAFGDEAIYVDVKTSADKLEEMLKLSGGKRQVPVILEKGKVKVGYGGS